MFATPAIAQTAIAQTVAGAAPGGGPQDMLLQLAPVIAMIALAYFLLFRPQQQQRKRHQEQIAGVKRGDTVVLSSGVIGKVSRVDDAEVQLDIAPNVSVKVVKSMIATVRTPAAPAAANDAKS